MAAAGESPTLADVAKHAGVSLATASRVLNGSTRVVNAELQARVAASARALHYAANVQAQAVARGTSRTVALIVGDVADPYFAAIAAGVMASAADHRLIVTMAATGSVAAGSVPTLAALRGQRPHVVIVAASMSVDTQVQNAVVTECAAMERLGARVVFVGAAPTGFRAVQVRNRDGAEQLARALVKRGYQRFCVLSGPAQLATAVERATGFVSGLTDAGLPARSCTVVPGAFSRDGGYESTRALLAAGERPDCVFAVTDVMAVGAMAAIRDAGLTPGDDIAVAGFDDIEMLQDVTPALTTVALPLGEIGSRALELALHEPADADSPPIDGRVVLRDSTPGVDASD